MADPLWVTKVRLPVLRHVLVAREKILGQLDGGVRDGHLLTLVSAPAGYGKTTTLRMWAEQAGHPVAWVTLDRSDNDVKQFLTYVLTALQLAEDGLGQAALEAVENAQKIDLQVILGLLINDLYDLDHPIVLILEDYHQIENETIDRAIELILNQATPNLHVVVTTREDPNLPLTRLRVRNQLTEIRAADLSFSLEEACEFFSSVMKVHLSTEEMEVLRSRTEGWIAGLQLAAFSIRESLDPARLVEAFGGTHRHVLSYLIEEVLSSQPEDVREFLCRTSILDQLSPSLCEAVTGQKASTRYLQSLENDNLFLVSLDEERTWYRYHALFGELLRHQLLQVEPEIVDELHERAAGWYQKNGYIQKAVEHAFQISNSTRAAKLIENYAVPMLYRGEVSTVVGWFDRLPEAVMQSSPVLCIGRAWALALTLHHSRREEVEQALKAADDALKLANADEAFRNIIAGHSASIQAYLIRSPALACNMPEKVIETSERANQLLPEDDRGIRSVNALNIGYGYQALADLPAAEGAFKRAFEEGVAGGNLYAAIYGPISLIVIAMMKGQLRDALQLCETNIDRFNRLSAGKSFPPIGALYILKGGILLEEDRLVEAEQALTLGLSLEHWTGEFRAHTKGYSALARLRFIQGDWAGVAECLKSLDETRPEGVIYAQAFRHRLSTHGWLANRDRLEEAHRWVTQAEVGFDNSRDIARIDPIGEINLQTSLSAAHVLTRLAVRNPEAYSLLDVHNYLARQERFADAHGLAGWLIEIWIVRGLMYHVEGKAKEAHQMIQAALRASASRGFFRVFLDESDLMRPLLESVRPHLKDHNLSTYVKHLLETMPREPATNQVKRVDSERLTDRELEVLRLLAAGQTYREIGQQLFLSLNTVQFHVKNIYGKLLVNKRSQAVNKAREKMLIQA